MVFDSQVLFEEQLINVISSYPNLSIKKDNNGNAHLRGILDIPNDKNDIVGHFLIEIHRSKNFPFQFPILYEMGGAIPNSPDWHKYNDNSCCITLETDELIKCKNGIHVDFFIKNYVIPYFANQIFRIQEGHYKNGEYAHGSAGIRQFYNELMKTNNENLWVQYVKIAFGQISINAGRNDSCFCGSAIKYKHCHLEVFNTLLKIGYKRILQDFKSLT